MMRKTTFPIVFFKSPPNTDSFLRLLHLFSPSLSHSQSHTLHMALDLQHGSGTNQHSSEFQSQQQSSFDLPPYPQMIMEALESLNDKNGSNKTTIAKQIESTQRTIPPSHGTLLNYHLNQMKKTGQLIMVKNNYMKPDPNAPPKRGRGRPPKQKTQEESDAAATATALVSSDPPRSRGRPPKPRDPSEPSVQPKEKNNTGSGRPRGRPSKRPKTDSETGSAAAAAPESDTPAAPSAQSPGERRGRGRPPKAKTVVAPVGC